MEYWDAYDKFRRPLGYKIRRGDPIPAEARHLVVHMVYYNSKGEVLIQRRAETKAFGAGLWSITGGSATTGETSAEACVRETEEEMGFSPDMAEAALTLSFVTREAIVDMYVIKADIPAENLVLQEAEVAEAMWVGRAELETLARDENLFWPASYPEMILPMLDRGGYVWKTN
jgi:mutator protein MutT